MVGSLDEQYLTWLYARIGDVDERRLTKTYWSLFKLLSEKEFVWFVPNDDNRVEDGKYMRYEFWEESGLPGTYEQALGALSCSVLELIFGLAARLAFEADRDPVYWFWNLIDNLGLTRYNDRSFNERQVEDIVHNLIWRTYDPDGRGGLFPLHNPDVDQRKVELWYQLQLYVLEHE